MSIDELILRNESYETDPGTRLILLGLVWSLDPTRILELGTAFGYTTAVLALALERWPALRIESVEHDRGRYERAKELLADTTVELHNVDALDFLHDSKDESYEFIFVDDRHDREHVRAEAIEIKRILKPGGIAAFHDILHCYDLAPVIVEVFPDWPQIILPSWARPHDMGLMLVRKPEVEDR